MVVELAGRTMQVKALPIGIPFERFVQLSEKAPTFLNMSEEVKVILGVDRLDYTKGKTENTPKENCYHDGGGEVGVIY